MGIRSVVGTPVVVEGRLWGEMGAGSALEDPLPPDAEALLASFTELVATAIANAESRAALARMAEEQAALRRVAASRARIVAAADETRRRIERDLHDGVQQRLVTQALMLSGIRDRVPADVRAEVDEVRDELAATRKELRDLSRSRRPAAR
jgi:GAF domain-containing protein